MPSFVDFMNNYVGLKEQHRIGSASDAAIANELASFVNHYVMPTLAEQNKTVVDNNFSAASAQKLRPDINRLVDEINALNVPGAQDRLSDADLRSAIIERFQRFINDDVLHEYAVQKASTVSPSRRRMSPEEGKGRTEGW